MTLSPKLGITLLGDNDDINPVIVSQNSALLDPAGPCILFSPASLSTPNPTAQYDGQWMYNTLTQSLRRWNSSLNEWQSIVVKDTSGNPTVGFPTARPKLIASNSNTAASLIVGGGAGAASTDLNSFNFQIPASGSATGAYPFSTFTYVERGWFWWTGTPYPPTSKTYKAQIFTNIGYKTTPSGTTPDSNMAGQIGPPGLAASVTACIANSTFGYNSDKMSCKVPYYMTGTFSVPAQDSASTVSLFIRSVFQTDASQFPNTMSAGRSADALGSSKTWIYQAF